jgi:proline iminopeptidase
MFWRITKWVGLVGAALILLLVSSAFVWRLIRQHSISQARAIHDAHGVDSLERVRIGGIDQWIQVRGQDVDNPILLFVHGGPGVAFIPLAGSFQGPWEKHFTVVQWDQRGAGKTFASNDSELQRNTLTISRMQQDALEVVNYLRARFKRDKIFVIGHSWGSALGLWLAHEHAELLYAYVGTGQLIDAQQNETVSYQDALDAARQEHLQPAIDALEAVRSRKGSSVARFWEEAVLGPPEDTHSFTNVPRILTELVSAPEYSIMDVRGFIRGQRQSLEVLIPQIEKLDLTQLGAEFAIPVFFFEGRRDFACRPSLIWDYEQSISAPQKGFTWFEHSGHFAFYEEPQEFADELARDLLPLANQP